MARAAASVPSLAANMRAVQPSLSATFTSAPAATRSSAGIASFRLAASIRAVLPSGSRTSRPAPASINARTAGSCPPRTACRRAVRWPLSRAFTSAPAWSCARTWPTSPCLAAAMRASWAFLIAFWRACSGVSSAMRGLVARSSAAAMTTQDRHRDQTILVRTAENDSASPARIIRFDLSGTLVARLARPRADLRGRALHHPARAGPRDDGRRVRGRGRGRSLVPSRSRPSTWRSPPVRRPAASSSSGSSRRRGWRPGSRILESSSATTSARTRRAESSSSSSNT